MPDLSSANRLTFSPVTLTAAFLLAAVAAWVERRLDHPLEFPVGVLVGELAVLATILLNGVALMAGGTRNWTPLVFLTVVVHLPLAAGQGVDPRLTVGFPARGKPQQFFGFRG